MGTINPMTAAATAVHADFNRQKEPKSHTKNPVGFMMGAKTTNGMISTSSEFANSIRSFDATSHKTHRNRQNEG
jgi:hypothetical protein